MKLKNNPIKNKYLKHKNMKSLILICAMSVICIGSYAQTDSMKTNYNKSENMQDDNSDKQNSNMNKDCAYVMENGKMMKIVNGKKEIMDRDMTLKNGSVVRMDGTVKMKDGKNMKMKEGECLNMSGKNIGDNQYQKKHPKISQK
jgi:hypothetical protein